MGDLPLLRNPPSKTSRWRLCWAMVAVWELGLNLQSSVSIVLTLPDVADCGGQLFKLGGNLFFFYSNITLVPFGHIVCRD